MVDLRIDASRMLDSTGELSGWVCVCHQQRRRRGRPALHGRAGPGRAAARRCGRRHERPAGPGVGAGPDRRQPARADQGRCRRLRADREGQAPAGQPGRAARRAARPDGRPAEQHGRPAHAVRQDRADGHQRLGRLRRPDLGRAARPAHDHAQPVARGRAPLRRPVRAVQRAQGRPRRAGAAGAAGRARQRRAVQRHRVRGGRPAARARAGGDRRERGRHRGAGLRRPGPAVESGRAPADRALAGAGHRQAAAVPAARSPARS